MGGVFAEELLVAGGGLREKLLTARARGFGGGEVELFDGAVEEGLGGGGSVGGGGSGCGGLGRLGEFGWGAGGEQDEEEDGETKGKRKSLDTR